MMQGSSGEKLEVIMRNPWLVKAGVPLLLSAAAFITAKILSNRAPSPVSPVLEKEEEEEQEELEAAADHSSSISQTIEIAEMLEDLKRREYELEKRFFMYQDMKERESLAIEIRNKVCMEMNRLEFLAREASLMEAEARRMEEFMVEYLRVVKKLETSRLQKGLVEKKARKLRRRVGEKSKLVKEQSLCIKAREEEMMGNQRELERRNEAIVELEDEIGLIKCVVDQLKEEKIALLDKLEMVERSASTKTMNNEEDVVTKEAYDKVVEELEHTAKDGTAMENELIHLRWSNACLKHELKRCQEQLERVGEDSSKKSGLELEASAKEAVTLQQLLHDVECDGSSSLVVGDGGGSCLTQGGRFSKRKRLVRKLRKWVEGGKVDEKQKSEEMIKCFGRHSVAHSEEAYENFVHPRNSFSSL